MSTPIARRLRVSEQPTQGTVAMCKRQRGRPPIPRLREKILRSAADLFGEKEFHLVLTDEIAARAGVGKGSVYRQFGSKEALYAAVVMEGFAILQDEIRASLGNATSLRERVLTVASHMLGYFWNRRQFFTILRDPTALPRRQARRFYEQRAELSGLLREVLAEAVNTGELRSNLDLYIATESLLGMLRGINYYRNEGSAPEQAADTAVAIFLDGCNSNVSGSSHTARPEQ